MKKLFKMFLLLSILSLFIIGCDNNKGPFTKEKVNGKIVLLSKGRPAKGWVQNNIYDSNGVSIKVYEIDFDNGLPGGDFKLYDRNSVLLVDAKGKWKNGLYHGKITEGNDVAEGTFSINTNYLLDYSGNMYTNFILRTMRNGVVRNGKSEFNIKNGQLNGKFIMYYPNGKLKQEGFYKDGELDGNYKRYTDTGELFQDYNYKNGSLDGVLKDYNGYGTLVGEYNYKDGKPYGEQLTYYDNGNLKTKRSVYYEMEEGLSETYNEDGTIATIKNYLHGRLNGEHKEYIYPDGKQVLALEEHIDNGRRNGVYIKHDFNKHIEANYVDDALDGKYKEYDGHNTLIKENNYKMGSLHGEQKIYDSLGRLVKIETRNDSVLEGPLKEYNPENGKVILEANFSHGVLNGEFKKYTDDGRLVMKGKYVNVSPKEEYFYSTKNGDLIEKMIFTADNHNRIRYWVYPYRLDEKTKLSKYHYLDCTDYHNGPSKDTYLVEEYYDAKKQCFYCRQVYFNMNNKNTFKVREERRTWFGYLKAENEYTIQKKNINKLKPIEKLKF